jgi:hypothetical protein
LHPLETLSAANRFLDLGIAAEQIENIVASDRRFVDAKNTGEPFSLQKRRETYRKLEDFYGADLPNTLNWMVRKNPGTQLTPVLGGALR